MGLPVWGAGGAGGGVKGPAEIVGVFRVLCAVLVCCVVQVGELVRWLQRVFGGGEVPSHWAMVSGNHHPTMHRVPKVCVTPITKSDFYICSFCFFPVLHPFFVPGILEGEGCNIFHFCTSVQHTFQGGLTGGR